MNRKDFFKKLGIGVATAIVAPKVFAEMPTKVNPITPLAGGGFAINTTMTPAEVLKIWRQTGRLIFHPTGGMLTVNETIFYMGRKYLVVEKFAYADLEWRYKLRPFIQGNDIEITEGVLNNYRWLEYSNTGVWLA